MRGRHASRCAVLVCTLPLALHVDLADVPLQGARLPERAVAVRALVIASLHVDRADVRPQAARHPERALAVWALVTT